MKIVTTPLATMNQKKTHTDMDKMAHHLYWNPLAFPLIPAKSRNSKNATSWVPATDGMHQRTLDLWTQLTNHSHSPMTVEEASKLRKGDYESPHAVGVYLSHWNLLNTLAHRPIELLQTQPENKHAYLILEDDATCAPGVNEEIERTIEQLPSDWDLLFVGGKPFSSFENKKNESDSGKQLIREYKQQDDANNWTATDTINQLLRHSICQGAFNKTSGPFAPDGNHSLSQENQAYWRVDYLTKTHSYVVNPKRVSHVARLLQPTMDVPVDIRLGDLIKSGQLKAYMTTRMWCDQETPWKPLLAPQTWQGYFLFVVGNDSKYIWQTQMHLDDEDCAL